LEERVTEQVNVTVNVAVPLAVVGAAGKGHARGLDIYRPFSALLCGFPGSGGLVPSAENVPSEMPTVGC
jgi:hypothetical protein